MGNRNILQDFPSYMLSKEAPDIDEILNNYDDLKKKVQVLQNITTGVFQYQGSRSLKVLVDDIRAYLVNGGDNKYSKGCFYNINDLTGFSVAGLTVGDNIVFTGTIVTYSDESPVSYNPQTGMGNICGFEFDRFPSVVDLSEYLKTADADAKYALISDLENILKDIENNITQGGSIDSLTLDIPITDTSRINKMYNVVRGQWNGNINEAGGYHRFNYNCTMTNVKIINDNGSYYIQCNASDIPSEFYYRQYGNFTLNDGLSTFDITIGSYIYTFEYTSYSGTPLSEVLKFSLNNVQYGPKFSDDYYASKFVDNVYDLGDIAAVWAVDINVGDNFVITKNGFDPLVGNYATSGELSDLQNKLDTINKTLSGVYKNGGDVTEMTLDVPVSSSKINTMYNVKSGFVASGSYGEHGAFRYKITIKNAYILKTTSDSGNTYELCFKLGDIPSELWYYSIGMVTFYGKFQNAIDYQPSGVGWHFDFTSPSELSIQIPQEGLEYIVKLPYKTSYSGPTIDSYFSDKTFTDNKYQLGNIATIWYRNDISIDDNFVITEHGYDVLSYKITDYISKYQFDSLSATVAKKANSSDVYTKDEIRQKAFISETVSGYPVVIPKDEMLAGEQYTDFRIYGNADGFGTLNSSTNKYTINLTCRGKNLIYNLSANSYAGITPTKNDDGSVTLNGTATSIYAMARGRVSYLPPGTYHLSGCPQGGSEDTYCIKIDTLGVDTGEGATFTLDTAKSVIPIIYVKKGTTLDNATFKPQIEIGEAATEFEKWGQKSDITITLDSALGENEYVDVINKKRYNGDGTVSSVTVSDELSIFDSDMNVIYCGMTTSPSKIEISYYRDINNIITETSETIKNNRPSKSVPIEPSVVSEIMRCATSYLNNKDSLTFTDSGKGTLFDDDFDSSAPKIDCSSLMMAWVMGIPYEWSKYAGKDNIKHYDYGIKLPTNPYATDRPNRYYTHELAHYFDDQGWCFIPDKNYSDIASGDIIFVSFKSRDGNSDFHDNAYMKIDHCLLVLGYKDPTHLICLHTSEQSTIRFYDVCVLPSEHDSTSTNGYNNGIKLVARLPFKAGHISEKPIFIDSHNPVTTTNTTNGFLRTISLDEPLKTNTAYTLIANVENAFAQEKPSTNNYFGIRASYADGTADETIFSWALNAYPQDNLYRCHFVTGNKEILKLKLYILSCTVAGHVYKYSALYEGSVSITPHESDLNKTQSYTVDKNGNAWFAGNIKIGGSKYGDANAKEVATIDYVDTKKQDKFAKRMFNNTTGKNYLDETTIKEGYYGGETSDWNVFYTDTTARSVVIELESGTYTMSAVADDTTVVFERYAINGTVTNIAGNHFTFTLTEASKVYITWHTQHHTYVNMKTMIELGNEATDYEPYIPVPGTGTTKFIAPEQFGAKGDNVTNDLDALNKCVQQAVKDHIAVRADGTYYIGSATLNLDVQGTDIYINRIRSTSTDCCVKLQGSNNTITINNVIASAGNGFVITTDESHLSSNSNYIFIKNISAKNHCFYKYSHDDTIRITYNTFNFLVLGSDSGDCIRDYGGGGNNIFNGNDVYCYAQQGHGIYVKGVAFSYYENFAFEQDVKYGVVCEDSCENTFNNMRTGELANEMRQNSNDRFVIKFVGNSYGNTFKSPMPYVAVKNEVNAFDAEAAQKQYQNTYFAECIRYNGINTVKMSVLQPYYYTQDDDGTKNWRAFSGTGDIVTYYNHTGIRLDYDVTHDIDVTEYTPYTTDDYIPTIFNIKTNTTITLNDMYFPFGISKITIVQSDDNKATVKDRHGNTIFDGSVRGNGKYELQCIVKENDTSTAFFVDCFCFTGENDEWIEVNDVYTKTEIDSAGYVKNTDYASYAKGGVVKIGNSNYGVALNSNNELYTVKATNAQIAARDNDCVLIAPRNLNAAVKAALTDDKRISDMTDAEKANARDVIGANGKYDTIIDYTYTGEDAATELNILLTLEQLQKIKKYEKFFCYVTYNVSATTGTTSFWASATLNLCTKGTTTLLSYSGIFMRAANTVQKITADNTPITWIATTDKVRLPDSNVCITNVLDYGATQYNLFNISTLTGGSSRVMSPVLYQYSETNYDWVMQLKSPTAMPFVNGMKFIMWGK